LAVAPNLLVEALGAHPVERRELGIEKYLVAAQHDDGVGYTRDRYGDVA
jgi:hypothetical protein